MATRRKKQAATAARERPLGVTVLVILNIIGGVGGVLAGLGFILIGGTIAGSLGSMPAGLTGAVSSTIGVFVILLGIITLAIAYGFWKGMRWSWWLAIILYALSLVLSLISIIGNVTAIFAIIIDAILIYYLTRPNVKAWFKV